MSETDKPLNGKNCVITGATSGIGRAAARALAQKGANLLLIGRRSELGQKLAAQLAAHPGTGNIQFQRADLSEQKQVRALAAEIARRYDRIDVLINNAGARYNTFQPSADGIELTFATNHLSHFLLTHLLLEPLDRAKGARVISVGSGAHATVTLPGPWMLDRRNYDRKLAYAKSKLANIVFAYELARRCHQMSLVSNAVDPGGVATNLGRNNGLLSWARHLLYYALKRELLSPRRGAETIVYLACDPTVAGVTGKYFFKKRPCESSPISHDRSAAAELWLLSSRLTGLEQECLVEHS